MKSQDNKARQEYLNRVGRFAVSRGYKEPTTEKEFLEILTHFHEEEMAFYDKVINDEKFGNEVKSISREMVDAIL